MNETFRHGQKSGSGLLFDFLTITHRHLPEVKRRVLYILVFRVATRASPPDTSYVRIKPGHYDMVTPVLEERLTEQGQLNKFGASFVKNQDTKSICYVLSGKMDRCRLGGLTKPGNRHRDDKKISTEFSD